MNENINKIIKDCVKDAVQEALKNLDVRTREVCPPANRSQAAKWLGISIPTLDGLIKRGELKAFRIANSVRVHSSELERFVNERGL